MKEKIENILIRNNLNPYLKGFVYIVSCIEYMFENNVSPSEIRVCKELYVEVAEMYNVSWRTLERSIRSCIYESKYKDVHGFTPTNSKFLSIIFYSVKNEAL